MRVKIIKRTGMNGGNSCDVSKLFYPLGFKYQQYSCSITYLSTWLSELDPIYCNIHRKTEFYYLRIQRFPELRMKTEILTKIASGLN